MNTHAGPPRTAGPSRRVLGTLTALAVALALAFVLAPPVLAAGKEGGFDDQRDLTASFRAAFTEYWSAGGRDLTPRLEAVVDYWFRYHMVKAVTAALLLAVLVVLGAALWKAYLHAAGRGTAVASAGVAVTILALFALVIVMANIQGAGAPFASLLPMLVDGPAADGRLAGTLEQVRQRLAETPDADGPLDVMIGGFAHYHAVMAVLAALAGATLAGLSVQSWRRFARTGSTDRRTRRAAGSFGALMALSSVAVIVVAVANTTVAADPVPALAAFFAGGW